MFVLKNTQNWSTIDCRLAVPVPRSSNFHFTNAPGERQAESAYEKKNNHKSQERDSVLASIAQRTFNAFKRRKSEVAARLFINEFEKVPVRAADFRLPDVYTWQSQRCV